jgi:hypothetical protein
MSRKQARSDYDDLTLALASKYTSQAEYEMRTFGDDAVATRHLTAAVKLCDSSRTSAGYAGLAIALATHVDVFVTVCKSVGQSSMWSLPVVIWPMLTAAFSALSQVHLSYAGLASCVASVNLAAGRAHAAAGHDVTAATHLQRAAMCVAATYGDIARSSEAFAELSAHLCVMGRIDDAREAANMAVRVADVLQGGGVSHHAALERAHLAVANVQSRTGLFEACMTTLAWVDVALTANSDTSNKLVRMRAMQARVMAIARHYATFRDDDKMRYMLIAGTETVLQSMLELARGCTRMEKEIRNLFEEVSCMFDMPLQR